LKDFKLPNDSIKISVIGTGRMGFNHARLLSRLGILDSVIDSEIDSAMNVGKRFNVPYYSSMKELNKVQNPNGIIIAVPTALHPQISIEVLENLPNLRALLIEKPIAPTVKEAEKLKSILIKHSELKVIIGHVEVYNPLVTRIHEIVKEQEILGDLRSCLIQRRGAVAETRISSIGDVEMDIGVHDFDIAMRLFPKGKINVYSRATKLNGFDNSCVTVISSDEVDFFITFLMSREFAGKLRKIDIEGSKATLTADLLTQILELRSLEIARGEEKSSAIRIPFSNGEQIKVYGEPLLSEIFNFIDCIKGVDSPKVSIDDGINAIKLVEATRDSIRSKKVINIEV